MRIFGLSTGADTGGISIGIKRAFDRYSDWTVRSMAATQNYLDYPVDEPYSRYTLELIYDHSDVIHLHNTLHGHRWYDDHQGKPTVIHHHSRHGLAENGEEARQIGAVQVGSTLDLAIIDPSLTWVPAPVDIPAMRALREKHYRPSDRIRIAHAPTNRAIKGTAAFLAAVARMQDDGLPVEPILIEGVSHAECLRRKATADIVYDQLELGYGCNAIEAWAMGVPVIAGIEDDDLRSKMIAGWGSQPFLDATPKSLEKALRMLVRSERKRGYWAAEGTAHVERWHDEAVTVAILKGLYSNAPRTVPGGSHRRIITRQPLAVAPV